MDSIMPSAADNACQCLTNDSGWASLSYGEPTPTTQHCNWPNWQQTVCSETSQQGLWIKVQNRNCLGLVGSVQATQKSKVVQGFHALDTKSK
jgi:hypothetical protein